MELLRPYGTVIDGHLVLGVELLVVGGVIEEIRPHTGVPDAYVLSPAFVNAHSHLEYRGMLDRVLAPEYAVWIRELTQLKQTETPGEVEVACLLATQENRQTGVARIGEHSDRPGSAHAMSSQRLDGWIFQEVITFLEEQNPAEKLAMVREKLKLTQQMFPHASLNPHAYQTVDLETLKQIAQAGQPMSIHVAETEFESQLTRDGTGPLAEARHRFGLPVVAHGTGVVEMLDKFGALGPLTQCVHLCAVTTAEIELLALRQVTAAHCPRSNIRLKCPKAPVRELLDAGIAVGLGLDSAASSGKIDMFDEMNAALQVSCERGRPLKSEEVWRMATSMGDQSFGLPSPEPWDIYEGSRTPMIKIHFSGARTVEDLIENGSPSLVEHL